MGIAKRNILLYGDGGTGKTVSTLTLLKPEQLKKTPDIKLVFLCAESNAVPGIEDGVRIHAIKQFENRIWIAKPRTPSKQASFKQLAKDWKENFSDASLKDAANVKVEAGDRKFYQSFLQILYGLAEVNAKDFFTKQEKNLGDIFTWDTNYVLIVDSLTAVVDALVEELLGPRQVLQISDYNQVKQKLISSFLIPLTQEGKFPGSLILLGHADLIEDPRIEQPNESQRKSGSMPKLKTYPRTFGNKASAEVIKYFHETIFCSKDERSKPPKYYFNGANNYAITSVRRLPDKEGNIPDFSQYAMFEPERF